MTATVLWNVHSGCMLKFYIGQLKAPELCLQRRPVLLCQEVSSTMFLSASLNGVQLLVYLLDWDFPYNGIPDLLHMLL